jgi:hypothetical protein
MLVIPNVLRLCANSTMSQLSEDLEEATRHQTDAEKAYAPMRELGLGSSLVSMKQSQSATSPPRRTPRAHAAAIPLLSVFKTSTCSPKSVYCARWCSVHGAASGRRCPFPVIRSRARLRTRRQMGSEDGGIETTPRSCQASWLRWSNPGGS